MNENSRSKNCVGKIAYDSQAAARAAAATLYFQKGTKLKTYKCKNCGLWHLSSSFNT